MKKSIAINTDYKIFIQELKHQVASLQIKATLSVNKALINLYWLLAEKIVQKQKKSKWGDSFISHISKDLQTEFPEMKGFSERNIKYISFIVRLNQLGNSLLPN